MTVVYRKYTRSDYKRCEELVEQVWSLSKVFNTPGLSTIAKLGYTKGSLEMSNYKMVAVADNKVEGFIFGLNENKKIFPVNFYFRLSVLWKLFSIKGDKTERDALLRALKTHKKNRSKIVQRGESEILLFVVSDEFQGKGCGKQLWCGFKDDCVSTGVESIVVSTNKGGASSFYETIGFTHLGDFNSPLHDIAQWQGQPCFYKFYC